MDIFGFVSVDLQTPRLAIEKVLGVQLEPHYNLHAAGGQEYLAKPDGERFAILLNFDEAKNKWFREQFKNMAVLFSADSPARGNEIRDRLMRDVDRIQFLQREIITKDRRLQNIRNINGIDTVVFDKPLDLVLDAVVSLVKARKPQQPPDGPPL
jgi:hypothetical protein